jgi:poly(3-hydroxybutyrate) depolymerase
MLRSRLLAITAPWISLAVATFVACGSPVTPKMVVSQSGSSTSGDMSQSGTSSGTSSGANAPSGSAGSGTVAPSGATSGTTPPTTGTTSGTASGATSGTTPPTTGTASGASTGSTSGTASGTASGASGSGGTGMKHPVLPSTGCGPTSKWTGATGMWVSQPTGCAEGNNNQGTAACQAIPVGSTVPAKSGSGTPENRGWWVYVPAGYDSTKPYRVIYNGAGCGDGNYFNAGQDGYKYQTVDGNQAILVGLDYDTYSDVPGCYDNRNATSNDFTFFPWLQNEIESTFCVDKNHEFFSGYSSGGWVMQQFNCAFPDKLRGSVAVTGCEPGVKPYPGSQFSPCVSKPTAAFYVKDFNDTDNTYACILPACARVLAQNGCTTTTCNPLDTTTTTPYVVPKGVTLPPNAKCVQFNGCPADYPVVFCVTYNQDHSDATSWGVIPLFWDWMSNKLAD